MMQIRHIRQGFTIGRASETAFCIAYGVRYAKGKR